MCKENGLVMIQCDPMKVSDGVHTFGELYEHRCLLFIALMKSHPGKSWRSLRCDDGSPCEGNFIAGMWTPKGDITYHLPDGMWYMLDGIKTLERAWKYDGHGTQDVANRIENWVVDGEWN